LPILSALMLAVEGDTMTVQATDLEISLTTCVGVTDAEAGAVAVPGKQFVDYCKTMPGASLNLTVDAGTMVIKSGRSRYKLQVIGTAEEFPVLPKVAARHSFTAHETVLAEALRRTVIAAATDDTRPILCGVLFRLAEDLDSLVMAATDTHRLHITSCTIHDAVGTGDVLVSSRTCSELVRLLGADRECRVTIDQSQIQVETAAGTITGRRIEGQFPKYEKVVPDYTRHLDLKRDALAEVVKRASVVAADAANRLFLEFADGQPLRVTASAEGGAGEAEEEVEVTGFLGQGQDTRLAANCKFLLEAVQCCPSEELQFLHEGFLRPVLLHGSKRDEFLAVVMPMSLQ
jgi:DNA polymerase-3 subunit beta